MKESDPPDLTPVAWAALVLAICALFGVTVLVNREHESCSCPTTTTTDGAKVEVRER